MKPLIVGVDPGSTSAVAAVDLNGEIELLESGKNFPPRDIIKRIIKVGKPVIVASDKGSTPSKVEKIANSVGAEIFEPEQDLSSERKKELGKGANSHELDAVASAVHAQKQLHKDIRKIEKYNEELDISEKTVAQRIFQDKPPKPKKEPETVNEDNKSEENIAESSRDLKKKRLETKIENLENQVQKLKSELGEKEAENQEIKDKLEDIQEQDREDVLENREVKKREAIIKDKNREIEGLEDKLENFRIREKQYRKAIDKIFKGDHRPVPLVGEEVERVPEEAVTHSNQVLEKLEKRGSEIHYIEDVEGIELKDFIVVDELPETEDFESVINEYREEK